MSWEVSPQIFFRGRKDAANKNIFLRWRWERAYLCLKKNSNK
jgi:hypothetical protein